MNRKLGENEQDQLFRLAEQKKPQTNPKSGTQLTVWELAQVFNGLFGLTYPQERKRHRLCLQSKCSTFLSSALLSQKGCLQSCCRSGKELSLGNAEGNLLRWKGLKNRNERNYLSSCYSHFPQISSAQQQRTQVNFWVNQHQNNTKEQVGSCPFQQPL